MNPEPCISVLGSGCRIQGSMTELSNTMKTENTIQLGGPQDHIEVVERALDAEWAGKTVRELAKLQKIDGSNNVVIDAVLDKVIGTVETFGQMMTRTRHVAIMAGRIEQIRLEGERNLAN